MTLTSRKHCPFLGLLDDAETHLTFPSLRNVCHRASPHESVALSHQNTFCLSAAHRECPVFRASLQAPLPAELRENPPAQDWRRFAIIGAALLVMLVVLTALWIATEFRGQTAVEIVIPSSTPQASHTPAHTQPSATFLNSGSVQSPSPTGLPSPSLPASSPPSPSDTPPIPPATLTPANIPTATVCAFPIGWAPYVVQLGDTLYQLALAYGVSVADLQNANCLGASTIIKAGQLIYVPNLPTRTPAATLTASPLPSATQQPANSATPTEAPTAPPTVEPPTVTPPLPTPFVATPTQPAPSPTLPAATPTLHIGQP